MRCFKKLCLKVYNLCIPRRGSYLPKNAHFFFSTNIQIDYSSKLHCDCVLYYG